MNKKLKIAIIGSRGYPYVYSGYETLVKELAERLVKNGHEVRIYCHSYLFKKQPRNINGIELIYIPAIKSKFLSQITNSFLSFIHVCFSRYDTVFAVNSANGVFGLMTLIFGKKTFINVDGLEWLRPKWKGIGSVYYLLSSYMATKFFKRIITDSEEMKKIYLNKFNTESVVIAYGSTMIKNLKLDIHKLYNLKKNNYYLIVGRLIPDNNSLLIIENFLKVNTKRKLVIVGDVPYRDKYASIIKSYENERVVLLGYVKNQKHLSRLYEDCFFYIHGHEYGGTNPTMINAIDMKCRIIALQTKFNEEMLFGLNCIFFEKKSRSVRDAFKICESNLVKRIDSKKNIDKKYDWDFIVQKYTNLFYEI